MNRIHIHLNTFFKLYTRNGNINLLYNFSIYSLFFTELFGFFLTEQFHLDTGPIDYGFEVIFDR